MLEWVSLILGVAKPLIDIAVFNIVTGYLREYEGIQKDLQTEKAKYPNWDDSKIESLLLDSARLKDAIDKQMMLIKASVPAS